jgi:hypothetical protein
MHTKTANPRLANTPTYDRLRAVLLRYQGAHVVDPMLAVACRKRGLSPRSVGPEHLEALLQELSHGIRLFCAPEQLGQMMVELAALADENG